MATPQNMKKKSSVSVSNRVSIELLWETMTEQKMKTEFDGNRNFSMSRRYSQTAVDNSKSQSETTYTQEIL